MKLIRELEPIDFYPWGGAKDTMARILREGKSNEFNALVEECFGEDSEEGLITETKFNDFLWFDRDFIFEHLGIKEEE